MFKSNWMKSGVEDSRTTKWRRPNFTHPNQVAGSAPINLIRTYPGFVCRNLVKAFQGSVLIVSLIGPSAAETYSTADQYGMVRNHATHEDAEKIILTGEIVSTAVERGTHWLAVASEGKLYNCAVPWDSYPHCRSETSEPLFAIKK